jgi:hypothetical protein
MGAYVGASYSRLSVMLFITGISLFIVYTWKGYKNKLLIALAAIVVVISPFLYMYTFSVSGYFFEKFSIGKALPSQMHARVIANKHSVSVAKDEADVRVPGKIVINSAEPAAKERKEYWRFYANSIIESHSTLLWGHNKSPDRYSYPSAHNYYLDYAYHFGIIALLPLIYLIMYTVKSLYTNRLYIVKNPIIGIAFVCLFFILIDSIFKVGFRQPYPGIYMFFIWGVLLSRLHVIKSAPLPGKQE